MKKPMFALTTIYLLWAALVAIPTGEAATTFVGAIISIHTQRTITLQTMDGQTWAFAVADSSIVNQEQVGKGDRVRIEVDLSGRITKIAKLADRPMSEAVQSLEEGRP